ncbi:RNA polymerase sigma-70 factor [uncultured Sunxiuqinia sp.]|uniref:RNA polymerase sigma-70 factor n=1 Tax=uncultured Sunxiuqinia sp. TaxID=1573825 RepID=UPI002AA62109|nr:RNA polymerase sigma-70 factor [uncultured Sunxiuqinia sp.]
MDFATQKNKNIASQLRRGDVRAFDELYGLYSQRLYGFAFSMLKNKEDAKEVVQETFFKLWNKKQEINTSHSLKAFLFSIAYNITVDLFRASVKDSDFLSQLKNHLNQESNKTDELLIFNELNERLSNLVAELPEQRKKIYLMSREEGLGHKEIAEKLGIAVKTVENQINLTLKYIRKNIDSNSFLFLFICLFC